MSFALQLSTTWTVYDCVECHMPVALPDAFERRARSDGFIFYCSMGHPQRFTESTEQKLRKEIEAEKKRREWAEVSAREARESATRSYRRMNAYKSVATKARHRIANGVCPCCKRSFENIRRHIATKHPKWKSRGSK